MSKAVPTIVSTASAFVKCQEARPSTHPSVYPHHKSSHSGFTSLQIKNGIPVTSDVRPDVHTTMTTHPSPGVVEETRERVLSNDTQPSKGELQSPSPLPLVSRPPAFNTLRHDADSSVQQTPAYERADIAAAYPTNLILSTREQVAKHSVGHVVTSPKSSWMPKQYVAASSPTTNSHPVTQTSIIAASNVTPLSTAISEVSSPTMGAPQSPTINLAQIPGRGRLSDGRAPKRSVTGSTAGSGSGIVPSKYANMVFEEVPPLVNIFAWLFTWILLAGFVVLPSTFDTLGDILANAGVSQKVVQTIDNLPLYVLSFYSSLPSTTKQL